MTIKDAILKSMEDLEKGGSANEIYQNILKKGYYVFTKGKTPERTVHAVLGDFIRKEDNRVKRIKDSENKYFYYLSKNEDIIFMPSSELTNKAKSTTNTFLEKDLHKLLVTYLGDKNIFGKTINHETSNKSEGQQKWIHPDIIGAKIIEYNNKTCQSFFKAANKSNIVEIYSYELKKEINSDYDLKQCYFQAVSNSSWANYGFLVAFEIASNLLNELERLSHSFGMGVVLLKANPHESQELFPSRYRPLDFKTIEKLCNINDKFNKFIEQIEKVISAEPKYSNDVLRGLKELCDERFKNDTECHNYCIEKGIPIDETNNY